MRPRPSALDVSLSLTWGVSCVALRRVDAGAATLGDLAPIPLPPSVDPGAVLVRVSDEGASFVAPHGLRATVERGDGSIEVLEGDGSALLFAGDGVELGLGAFHLHVLVGQALARSARPPRLARASIATLGAFLGAALVHVAALALGASGASGGEARAREAEDDRTQVLRELLAAAERAIDARDPNDARDARRRETRAPEHRGTSVDEAEVAFPRGRRGLVRTPERTEPDPVEGRGAKSTGVARARAMEDAGGFGMVGLILALGPPPPPFVVPPPAVAGGFGTTAAIWAPGIDEVGGAPGLALTSAGRGSGSSSGPGEAIEIGTSPARDEAARRALPEHRSGLAASSATDRAAGDAPRRVLQRSSGRFRGCYTAALRTSPTLAGRVTVRFAIGSSGAVVRASDAGSSLPAEVTTCVVRVLWSLSFAPPTSGGEELTHTFDFSPPS